ncbi:hypothetical protein D9758_001768 [Tetrapyrgos nigripes]|uniref:DUF6534 domain-containing protein n=1 Tax=Tetrapyrgos nigripes TaxID=182062 RepID=A0A8H5LX97_9AGAR|nr:hypothetical protein D9758_001768 [Tetrapyrgos nigripes]
MASPEAEAAILAALLKPLKEALGFILVGFILATTLYGISVLQTYQYFRDYADGKGLKLTVAALFFTDTLSTALVSHAVYTYVVLNLGDLLADSKQIWSFILENGILSVTTIIAQGYAALFMIDWLYQHDMLRYYMRQIYIFSENRFLAGIIGFLALATFALGIKETVYESVFLYSLHLILLKKTIKSFQHPTGDAVSQNEVLIVGGIIQGLAALNDIIITCSLVYYLREKQSGMRSTIQMVDKIILWSISRGTITALCQILFMVLNVSARTHVYWQPFHQMVGKLYVNSVLSSLNMRKQLRQDRTVISTGVSDAVFGTNSSTAPGHSATAFTRNEGALHNVNLNNPIEITKSTFKSPDNSIEMQSLGNYHTQV